MYATKDIKKGEEILTSYGDGYWQTRVEIKK
jgi:SET domain-containing protein